MDPLIVVKKYGYQEMVTEMFGKAVFLGLDELLELHRVHAPDTYFSVKQVISDMRLSVSVAYVLDAGICTGDDCCCNGIRYGSKDYEYTSLPNLPADLWIPF